MLEQIGWLAEEVMPAFKGVPSPWRPRNMLGARASNCAPWDTSAGNHADGGSLRLTTPKPTVYLSLP